MKQFLTCLFLVLSLNAMAAEGVITTKCVVKETGNQCILLTGVKLKNDRINWERDEYQKEFNECVAPFLVTVDWSMDLDRAYGHKMDFDISKPVKNLFGKTKIRAMNKFSVPLREGLSFRAGFKDSEKETGIRCSINAHIGADE